MFTLVLIDDDIPIKPNDLRHNQYLQLKKEIQIKYVDRVIPHVGLCIEFYDFVKIKDAHIYPGDGKLACGEPYVKVEFNLIIFRPLINEWLIGSIADSGTTGLRVSLGFFEDVLIPPANLITPHAFDPSSRQWVWKFTTESEGDNPPETFNYFFEKGTLIRFRVVSVNFAAPAKKDTLPTGKKESPMTIIGAADLPGLGCLLWWPDTSHNSAAPMEEDGAGSTS
mmetsp:Transcript_62151/g.148254  ORF Transcript_62151/g.148254 Transcript_62151/m.148254 type:complete len:224 (-) Transcript_62151:136-807(-)|eukprot:CAMPEP_0178440642 /NCGR_PEP_ID=MMETSP0689_2-20121128/36910_1 /TAXON_ID=160604 /ORGANISM="Amphidinium massartii, Strain CS-259" /LENGTH=223 /DNA_ID=CAMNT_0020063475 /DNA_START=26 /DNA_END=697 /DNA_ORIENTATION=+